MSTKQIVRAWKDEEYRLSLNESERAALPPHPSGLIELDDTELGDAAGGFSFLTLWGCPAPKESQAQFCTSFCSLPLACGSRRLF